MCIFYIAFVYIPALQRNAQSSQDGPCERDVGSLSTAVAGGIPCPPSATPRARSWYSVGSIARREKRVVSVASEGERCLLGPLCLRGATDTALAVLSRI